MTLMVGFAPDACEVLSEVVDSAEQMHHVSCPGQGA